jgi:hypothetical protein
VEPETSDALFVASATPITFVGDSHTLAYADLVFRGRSETYVTRSNYGRGLGRGITADKFIDAEGTFDFNVINALLGTGYVEQAIGGIVARHRAVDPHSMQVLHTMQRPREAPALVFSVGDIDCKFGFIKQLAAADFDLPASYGFDGSALPSPPAGVQSYAFGLVNNFAKQLLAPYFRGLIKLAKLGFTNIFLHALPPQTVDDDAFERINAFRAPALLRYKATVLFNALLREFAYDYPEFRFLDIWDRVTTAGVVAAEFHLDGSHLNRRAAAIVVGEVIRELERRARRASIAGGTSVAERAVPRPKIAESFAQDGVVLLDLGPGLAAELSAGLAFGPAPEGASLHDGWAGDPLGASRFVRSARVGLDVAARCAAALESTEARATLASCVGGPWRVTNLRALATERPEDPVLGPPPLYCSGVQPPGLLRAMIYLTSMRADSEPLVFLGRNGIGREIRPAAGALVIYDPARVDHREAAGLPALDLFIAPAVDGQPPQLLAAGPNYYWPLE